MKSYSRNLVIACFLVLVVVGVYFSFAVNLKLVSSQIAQNIVNSVPTSISNPYNDPAKWPTTFTDTTNVNSFVDYLISHTSIADSNSQQQFINYVNKFSLRQDFYDNFWNKLSSEQQKRLWGKLNWETTYKNQKINPAMALWGKLDWDPAMKFFNSLPEDDSAISRAALFSHLEAKDRVGVWDRLAWPDAFNLWSKLDSNGKTKFLGELKTGLVSDAQNRAGKLPRHLEFLQVALTGYNTLGNARVNVPSGFDVSSLVNFAVADALRLSSSQKPESLMKMFDKMMDLKTADGKTDLSGMRNFWKNIKEIDKKPLLQDLYAHDGMKYIAGFYNSLKGDKINLHKNREIIANFVIKPNDKSHPKLGAIEGFGQDEITMNPDGTFLLPGVGKVFDPKTDIPKYAVGLLVGYETAGENRKVYYLQYEMGNFNDKGEKVGTWYIRDFSSGRVDSLGRVYSSRTSDKVFANLAYPMDNVIFNIVGGGDYGITLSYVKVDDKKPSSVWFQHDDFMMTLSSGANSGSIYFDKENHINNFQNTGFYVMRNGYGKAANDYLNDPSKPYDGSKSTPLLYFETATNQKVSTLVYNEAPGDLKQFNDPTYLHLYFERGENSLGVWAIHTSGLIFKEYPQGSDKKVDLSFNSYHSKNELALSDSGGNLVDLSVDGNKIYSRNNGANFLASPISANGVVRFTYTPVAGSAYGSGLVVGSNNYPGSSLYRTELPKYLDALTKATGAAGTSAGASATTTSGASATVVATGTSTAGKTQTGSTCVGNSCGLGGSCGPDGCGGGGLFRWWRSR